MNKLVQIVYICLISCIPFTLQATAFKGPTVKIEPWQSGYYVVIELNDWLTKEEKADLQGLGVDLLDYLPYKKYLAHVPLSFLDALGWQKLQKIETIQPVEASQKLDATLWQEPLPAYAHVKGKTYRYQLTLYRNIDLALTIQDLQQHVTLLAEHTYSRVWEVECNKDEVSALAALPYVQYIELVDEPGEPENYVGRSLHRSNSIHTDYVSSRQYDGTGIHVQMQDDGGIGPHIDYTGRVPQQFTTNFNTGDDHGDHVAGTIMGAGNLNPKARGMAPGADLYVYDYEPMNDSIVSHYDTYGIRITSTSYSNGCNRGYSSTARDHDLETRQLPELIHVFSAGNSNGQDCGYGAGNQWGNITGGHKVGKNVIAVANLNANDGIANSSSRGPAHDGRIKPDISAQGSDVLSTIPNQNYASFSGTSMACPGVSGSLAQLYQAYQTLEGHLPPSALLKAAIMNTAEDLGNTGPDFIFGWGRINNLKALEVLEQRTYRSDTLDQGDSISFQITIPGGTARARIMLYWHDVEAAAGVSKALVNDLDLVVVDSASQRHLPYVLNTFPHPDSLNLPAVPGIDSLNNVEQVELLQPAAGTYTIQVTGRAIPMGTQDFFVVYTLEQPGLTLTYPIGGETFNPNEAELIRWDALADTGSFQVDYTLDGGISWQYAGQAFGSSRTLTWTVPDTAALARVRVTRGSYSSSSDTFFSILNTPTGLGIDTACCDFYVLSWNAVPRADAYIIYQLGSKYMEPIDTVTQPFYHMLPPTEEIWISVAALRQQEIRSQRAIAIPVAAGLSFNCVQPNNVVMQSIISPAPGSIPTCSEPQVSVNILNNSPQTVYNVDVSYLLDGKIVTEVIDSILPFQLEPYTFTQAPAFQFVGTSILTAWVVQANDSNNCDDTASVINEIQPGTLLTVPYAEDFASFRNCGIDPDCGETDCELLGGWYNEPNGLADDIDWRTDNGGTFSNGTGPVFDFEPGTIFGRYLYTEASGDCNNQQAVMTSPCFDLSNTNQPELSFYYHMWGPSMGQLRVQILTNGEWQTVFVRAGNQSNDWLQGTVDLTTYSGDTIAFRFVGITGSDYQSDLAIDYIQVYDLAPSTVIAPAPSTSLQLQPNPADNILQVSVTSSAADQGQLIIFDLLGRVVYQQELAAIPQPINTSGWPSGQYIVQYRSPGVSETQSIVIQH